ncbi:DUF3616 domain-containing protein [Bernardetia sp. ABR2-2B]|uniref:DUF3616 domain-containing protein n=1 Tax=Bernardetia sp. ABR2-2B TaxID=3127472 RepID=UPI0030CD5F45
MKDKTINQEPKRIRFYLNDELNPLDDKIRDDISSVVRTGKNIWIAFDESLGLERLELVTFADNQQSYKKHAHFKLEDYIDLVDDSEVDIEGLAYDDYYLWLTGSQSKKRNDVDKEDDLKEQIDDLSELQYDYNRYTLARIPCVPNKETGDWELHKETPHPENKDITLRAAQLKRGKKHTQLSKKLSKDRHFEKFMDLPCKENGFDIEGLAVNGDRIFLGMRGPVLRGWATIVEIQVKETKKGKLKLKKIGEEIDGKTMKYRKHFLDLKGMGIRELCLQTDDLLILGGPTMDLDGTISLYRIKDGLKDEEYSITPEVERLFDVVKGAEIKKGKDKAEGIAPMPNGDLLVVYDAPVDDRLIGETDIEMDIFPYAPYK